MDLRQPTAMNEVRALISMVHYCRDMWPRRSQILDNLKEVDIVPKVGNIICNIVLEQFFKKIKRMIYNETLLMEIPFTIHTDAFDKYLDAVISQKYKPMGFLKDVKNSTT